MIDESHPTMTRPVLTARDLAGCEHRLALDWLHADEIVDVAEDPSVTRRKDAAAAHRVKVGDTLSAIHSDQPGVFETVPSGPMSERVAATLAACDAGATWVWDAALPADRRAGRRGGSELLVRVDDGYVPVIVVNHRVSVLGGEGTIRTSPLFTWLPADDATRSLRSNRRDLLRLAHLTRLLAHAGLGSDSGLGGSIGLDADCIVVHDLTPVCPVTTRPSRAASRSRPAPPPRSRAVSGNAARVGGGAGASPNSSPCATSAW